MLDSTRAPYRLITRTDFDGVVSAALLRYIGLVEEVMFAHPKDMQDGLIEVSDGDVTAGMPYAQGVRAAFDHHVSERLRVGDTQNLIIPANAPSTSRVIVEYFGKDKFTAAFLELVDAVDTVETLTFSRSEVLNPEGWLLLNFVLDQRTGLARFSRFRLSNHEHLVRLIDYFGTSSVDDILSLPDVVERVEVYRSHEPLLKAQLLRCGRLDGRLLVIDFRGEDQVYAGNRFVKFALFPDCHASVVVAWGFRKERTVVTVERSIFNRTCIVDVGRLLVDYGGGGHANAGTVQVANDRAQSVIAEITEHLRN